MMTAQEAFVARMTGAKAEPEPAAKSAPAEAPAPTQEQAPALPEQSNPDPLDTRYERARRAFLRIGWTEGEFLEKVGQDKEGILRRGVKLARGQDRQAADYAAAKRGDAGKVQSSPSAAAASTSSNVQAPAAPNGLAELLARPEIAANPKVKAAIEAALSPVLAEQERLRAELDQRSQGSDVTQVQRVLDVRAELTKSVEELGDNDNWQDTLMVVDKIGDLPKYVGWDTDKAVLRTLLLDAATIALDVGERAQTAPVAPHGAAQRGMVDMSGRNPARPAAPTNPHAAAREQFVARMMESQRNGFAASHN
jgi:hypothetical protein